MAWVHRITVNTDGVGACAECGPIQAIRKKTRYGHGWRCPNPVRARYTVVAQRRGADDREYRKQFIPDGPLACGICGAELFPETVHVDHDHTLCGHPRNYTRYWEKCVRGLLCLTCNTGLGKFRDDPERLRKAASYLETANQRLRARGES